MEKERLYELIENPALLNSETKGELKLLAEKFPYFQTAWMLYLKNLKVINDPDYNKVLNYVAVTVPNRKKLYKLLNADKETWLSTLGIDSNTGISSFNLSDDAEPANSDSLIDRFLMSKPDIQRLEKSDVEISEDMNQNEILEKSLSEDEEFVTETLAMIYMQQKKYDKALESFKKLSLKYPEKSIYFASRIEEIEKLKNI